MTFRQLYKTFRGQLTFKFKKLFCLLFLHPSLFRVDPSPFPAIQPRKNVIAVRERIGKGGLGDDVPGHSGPTDFMFLGLSVFGYASELTRNKTYSFDQMKSKSFCVMFMRSKREYQMAVCLLSFCFKCTMIVYNGILVTDVQFLHYHWSNSKLSTVYFDQ